MVQMCFAVVVYRKYSPSPNESPSAAPKFAPVDDSEDNEATDCKIGTEINHLNVTELEAEYRRLVGRVAKLETLVSMKDIHIARVEAENTQLKMRLNSLLGASSPIIIQSSTPSVSHKSSTTNGTQ